MFPVTTRILLVEDMTSIRSWEKMQLEKLGFNEIFEAVNGKEALDILEKLFQENRPVNLILSDWRMPELDGLGFFKILQEKEYLEKIPFIMITAESETPLVLQALGAGVVYYMTKPFSAENLQKKLEIMWKDIVQKTPFPS